MSNRIIDLNGERHVATRCGTCGVWHTVPEFVWDTQVREGGFHFCPNGHSRDWTNGTEQKEQEEIRRERDRLKQDAARLEEEASLARVRAEKAEAANKRLKKRSSAGTCLCCSRTFSNMAEHMKHQHPEFVADGGAKVVPIKRGAKA
jgi:transposase